MNLKPKLRDMIRMIRQHVDENQSQEFSTPTVSHEQIALRDILTALLHVAREYNINFESALQGAEEVFEEEIAQDD